jgi:hypothetical protein
MRASRPERAAVRKRGMRIMSKKGIPLLFLVSLLCLFVSSCADQDAVRTKDSVGPAADESEKLEEEIGRSSELQELVAIRDELAARAIARNVTPEQIREAGYDVERANELLGITEAERRARFERIDELVNSLYARYPALRDAGAHGAASIETCDVECAASNWERYAKILAVELSGDGAPALRAPARGPLKCKMEQIVTGFAACAMRSGGSAIIYFVCSYGVFCASCEGGISDVLCG